MLNLTARAVVAAAVLMLGFAPVAEARSNEERDDICREEREEGAVLDERCFSEDEELTEDEVGLLVHFFQDNTSRGHHHRQHWENRRWHWKNPPNGRGFGRERDDHHREHRGNDRDHDRREKP